MKNRVEQVKSVIATLEDLRKSPILRPVMPHIEAAYQEMIEAGKWVLPETGAEDD